MYKNQPGEYLSKRIAVVSLILPGLPGKSGGEIRDAHILGQLVKNNMVDIYSIHDFTPDSRYDSLIKSCNSVYYPQKTYSENPNNIDLSKSPSFFQKLRNKLSTKGVFLPYGKYPIEIENFLSTFCLYTKKILQEKLDEHCYDILFITPQVNPAVISGLKIPEDCKCIFATYDVEKVRYKRLSKTKGSLIEKLTFYFEISKAAKYEKEVLKFVDGIISVSELDRHIYINEYNFNSDRVLSLENGVDTEYFNIQTSDFNNSYKISYIGNMGYAPNYQAVEYFVNQVFPLIRKEMPEVCFTAVGANANESLMKLNNNKDIIITGEVPDVRDYIKESDLICVPLLTGSGTKYKVLEAMSSGKAVVTTSIGAEGIDVIDGIHLLIRDNPYDFATAVINCLRNPNLCKELGQNGRKFVLEKHDWEIILPKLDEWIDKL